MAVVKCDSLTCNGRCGNANGLLICKLDGFWLEMMDVSAHRCRLDAYELASFVWLQCAIGLAYS